ncbi:MAG TPA: MmcQ/YjbR family DNA-binding protein [Alphaproteobacteria bacterium]|jgi:hypothetical protein|nr:MmcQ/YjbR family DNA-binding protein [Alphaproteobacteria bacterium]
MAVTFAMVRDAALELPSVTEGTSYGTAALKAGKALIARLKEDGETLVLKVDLMERDILLESQPDVFFLTDHYRGYPLVLVRLPLADMRQIESLLRRAWFAAAPKHLTKPYPQPR